MILAPHDMMSLEVLQLVQRHAKLDAPDCFAKFAADAAGFGLAVTGSARAALLSARKRRGF